MAVILINPYSFGAGGGGGGAPSVPITFMGVVTPAAGTGSITASGTFLASDHSTEVTIVTNDIALAIYSIDNSDTMATPTDHAHITGSPVQGGAGDADLPVFWIRETSSSDPGFTVADPGDHWVGTRALFRGCKTSGNPWNVVSTGTLSGSTSLTIPGVTTTVNNCMVVVIIAHGRDTSAGAQFSGWTCAALTSFDEPFSGNYCDFSTTFGDGGGLGYAVGIMATAGATGDFTVTQANANDVCYMVVALEPQNP